MKFSSGALANLLRDPLLHFLIIGAVLFAGYTLVMPRSDADKIVVSEKNLLTFIQYRSKIFDPDMAKARLGAMSAEELQEVVDEYVSEEALYREAAALGLDRQDYIIKRRMVQKVEFLATGNSESVEDADDAALEEFYRENRRLFATPGSYTFANVFIAGTTDEAVSRAQSLLQTLRAEKARLSDAPKYGERFPFGVNFVDVTPDQLRAQFGAEFLARIDKLQPRKDLWQGPVTSGFGEHLVMLTAKGASNLPPLEVVRDQVEAEYARVQAEQQGREAVERIVSRYPVEMRMRDARLAP